MEAEWKIGDCNLKSRLLLAPMAGITDHAFRLICEEYAPGLVVTEMVSAKGLMYHDEKTKLLLETTGEKRPIAIQIFGSEPETIAYAARYIEEKADLIDLNFGCPAPKVVKNGDGSKLLQNLDLAQKVAEAAVKNTNKPVTVKMRLGWNREQIVAIELAKRLEDVGVKAITVHGRTREEFYAGMADWEMIRKVKEAVSIPVIGNGDVTDGPSAKKMFDETGVDAIMIGRAALGKPWIFAEIRAYLQGREFQISKQEMLNVILKHMNLAVAQKGEDTAVKEMRKHISSYIKGQKDATVVRNAINVLTTKQEVEDCLKQYFEQIGE